MIIDGKDGKYSERRVVNRSVAIAYIMLAVLLVGAYAVEVLNTPLC